MKYFCSIILALFCSLSLFGTGEEYNIEIDIKGFDGEDILLGYYYGDNQYILDSLPRNDKGKFIYKGEEKLNGGVYMVILPPDNKFFDILVPEDDQSFLVSTSKDDFVGDMKVKGSDENTYFYEYLNFLNSMRKEGEDLTKKGKEAEGKEKEKIDALLGGLDERVEAKQWETVNKYPGTLTAAIIKASIDIEVPPAPEGMEEDKYYNYRYYKAHYFDHLDLKDHRMLRSPLLYTKLNNYIQKMTPQHPDSINVSIDRILEQMVDTSESFKYYLIHFLNNYAKSKIVGMDAVYVHLVDKYYATGKAHWTAEEQKDKMVKEAALIAPTLIGKKAPSLDMKTKDGKALSLYDVEAEYTILVFWSHDCSHCKKSAPDLVKFHEEYKEKGVKIFAVCSKLTKDVPKCWEFIEEHNFGDFINVVDPYHQSKFKLKYNIKTTPQIFILDKDKTIISKRIGVSQLKEVMDKLMKEENK